MQCIEEILFSLFQPDSETDMMDSMNGKGQALNLDLGGFLLGLLKTIFSGSSGGMGQGTVSIYFTFVMVHLFDCFFHGEWFSENEYQFNIYQINMTKLQ